MRYLVLLVCFFLISCGDNGAPTISSEVLESVPAAVENVVVSETERLTTWLDEQWEEQLDFSPQTRTSLGIKVDYDLLDDFSEEGEQAIIDWLRTSVATMQQDFDYDALTEDGKLSWDMWAFALQSEEAGIPFRRHGYLYGRGGIQSGMPNFLINFHRVDTPEDMEAYLARLRQIDRVFDQVLARAQTNAEEGVRQPAFGYDFAVDEITRITSGVPLILMTIRRIHLCGLMHKRQLMVC
jgi:uncharacterized protein (DUF885 family)